MTQLITAYTFRPEAVSAQVIAGIRTLKVLRPGVNEEVSAVCLSKLKRAQYSKEDGGGAVLLPDDDDYARKILWAARDLGPTIQDGSLLAGRIVHAKVDGVRHTFLQAPEARSSEMVWRLMTGICGGEQEEDRIKAILRNGDPNAAASRLFHGWFVEEGEGDEVAVAEHVDAKEHHGYLVTQASTGRYNPAVLLNGQTMNVPDRKTCVWRNFDGFKLVVVGIIPDTAFRLINDKRTVRVERPDQRKARAMLEEHAWNRRQARINPPMKGDSKPEAAA
jgi:hypothetical protein